MRGTKNTKSLARDKAVTRATIRLFFTALRVRPVLSVWSYLGYVVNIVSGVVVPFYIASIIEKIAYRQFDNAMSLIIWLGVILAANLVIRTIWNTVFALNGVATSNYLYKVMFDKTIHQDYDFFSTQYTGALSSHVQRMSNAAVDFHNLWYETLPAVVTTILGSTIVLCIKSPFLGLITALCVIVITIITTVAASLRLGLRRKFSVSVGILAGQLSDSLSHAVTVKSLAKEKSEAKRLDSYVNDWSKNQLMMWHSYTAADSVRTAFHSVMFIIILITSLMLFRDGKIGIATITLVQLYTIRLLDATVQVASMIKRYENQMSDAYQMMRILQRQPEIQDRPKTVKLPKTNKYNLAFNAVSFAYDTSSEKILNNFSLSIRPGERIGVVGASGAGKSTLTKLILRFHDVTDGSITINDIDIRDLSQKDLRRLVSYVPQEPLLFHRSILENISYANENAPMDAVKKAADMATVTAFTDKLPEGLDTLVGERGVKLSGGQRQRVAIARAILHDAPIIVLDEATSALDSETEVLIQKALWSLMRGKTAIVIAHRLSTIQKMDRIIVVDDGILLEQGTHDELLKQDGIYARLWKHQSGGFLGSL